MKEKYYVMKMIDYGDIHSHGTVLYVSDYVSKALGSKLHYALFDSLENAMKFYDLEHIRKFKEEIKQIYPNSCFKIMEVETTTKYTEVI